MGKEQNTIIDALARGVSVEAIVALIVRESGVPETVARQILSLETARSTEPAVNIARRDY